jgi:hypothetical protein
MRFEENNVCRKTFKGMREGINLKALRNQLGE